ncbi:baseplate J/gp47 family protein [Alkalilimnicola sp. S0819]|uniref:baseplate J/gp47 family protein n=1 Tax=Alkalilimnicola sp. S0819 TaxID=2613922 RepID=UPI001261BC4A|nr:baseplate J/gp47 family protein [Alkalilimnicola sp. S0819]KAB7624313.1 baseplate J/gp47 family protein [Alkalilimnicola sp. S0819]MPQ16137.1 baseplate J protein [Alkalilimnicola sp. S0819]
MPFARPTIQQLIERHRADMQSRLPDANPWLRRNLLEVLAYVNAGAAHSLHGHLAWNAKQLFPDTCDADQLTRFGDFYEEPRKAAAAATGNVDFTGTDGAVIPAGTELQGQGELLYTTDAEATISSDTASLVVTAAEAGVDGNQSAGAELTLVTAIAGVDSTATVGADGLGGGADIEPIDDWRDRIIERMSVPPQGGAAHDYVKWAKAVAGVTRAWSYSNESGIGTVTVRFMMDDNGSDGIPQAADVQIVQDHLDGLRPVGMKDLYVVAPIAVPLNLTIKLSPNTTTVQQAAEAELADMLRREGQPGVTIKISHLREAISVAAGEADHDLTSHSADITHSTGEIPVLGTITWQSL